MFPDGDENAAWLAGVVATGVVAGGEVTGGVLAADAGEPAAGVAVASPLPGGTVAGRAGVPAGSPLVGTVVVPAAAAQPLNASTTTAAVTIGADLATHPARSLR
jgi:hypothetical protein